MDEPPNSEYRRFLIETHVFFCGSRFEKSPGNLGNDDHENVSIFSQLMIVVFLLGMVGWASVFQLVIPILLAHPLYGYGFV